MRACVIYESMFGNTEKIARSLAGGLGGAMTRATTRHEAHQQGAPLGDDDRGLREFIDELPSALRTPIAVFDTRVSTVRKLPGSAAKAAAKELLRHHDRVVARASFYVEDTSGPLLDGEVDRAAGWGRELAASQS